MFLESMRALAEETCRKWFAWLKSTDFEQEGKKWPGSQKNSKMKKMPCQKLQDLAETWSWLFSGQKKTEINRNNSKAGKFGPSQCPSACWKTCQNIHQNDQIGGPTPPVVYSRDCSIWLPHFSIEGPWSVWTMLHLLWRLQKLGRFLDWL